MRNAKFDKQTAAARAASSSRSSPTKEKMKAEAIAPKVVTPAALQKEKEGNEHGGGVSCTCAGDGAEEEKDK